MPPSARPRLTSTTVATSPGCAPLREAYLGAVALRPRSWEQVESLFLRGMEGFDDTVARGGATEGDRQNGKGDFFNDLLALLLENCAGVQLYSRGRVPGLIIPQHNLDVTYPNRGAIEFTLEAKAVGTPKHPGNPKAKAEGRGGAADLGKRVKELGFKAIDLKAEHARIMSQHGRGPTSMSGDLTAWLRSVNPKSYVFFAARIINDKDLASVIRLAQQADLVSDGVGVFCFGRDPDAVALRYVSKPVPSQIELSRTLFRACQELTRIKADRPNDG